MSHRKSSPRKASLLVGAILTASTVTVPAYTVMTSTASYAAAPVTVVKSLSTTSGSTTGTNKIVISGTKVADGSTKKAVKFGTVTVSASNVTILDDDNIEVVVPATSGSKVVTVLVGDATKGPKYSYVAGALTVTTVQADLTAMAPKSETGKADQVIEGTGFEKSTQVFLGGKKLKTELTSASVLTVDLPKGLKGPQSVVVKDPRNNEYVGYVTYAGKVPTVTAASNDAINEAPTKITLTGTNLDAVTAVTFGTGSGEEKVAFAKTRDPLKLVVTVKKGAAKSSAPLKVVTKYGKNDSVTVSRAAAATPTVTAVAGAVAAGGNVTVTGTNLVGLKSATVTVSGKAVKAKVVSVASATSATLKLPAIAAGSYGIQVSTFAATPSTSYTFAVASGAPTVSAVTFNSAKTVFTITGTQLGSVTRVVFTHSDGTVTTATSGIVPNSDGTSAVVTLGSALADGTYGIVATNPKGSNTSFSKAVS